jgi:hypothetical protein
MPLLRVDEAQLASVGAQMMEGGVQGASQGAATLAPATGIAPAGADEVSAFAAPAYSAQTAALQAVNFFAQQEIVRYGAALIESAAAYANTDASGAVVVG